MPHSSGDTDNGGLGMCGSRGLMGNLYLPLNFAVNLATATKKPSFLGLHCVHPLFALGHNNPVWLERKALPAPRMLKSRGPAWHYRKKACVVQHPTLLAAGFPAWVPVGWMPRVPDLCNTLVSCQHLKL